jgi:limonene-1,2-epoxide hydrolase
MMRLMSELDEQLVREFCAAWQRRDIDELLGYFSDDAVYHNMPLDPAVGTEAIRTVLGMFVPPAEHIDWEILSIASSGNAVFTERVDRFVIGGKEIELPVAGIFEITDGKIAAWRDYFDLQTWMNQTS